ncbi:signal peptidase I [Arthrobacter sp. Z4-13]
MTAIDFATIRRAGESSTGAGQAGPRSTGRASRLLRKTVAVLTTTFLFLAGAAFLALAIGPRLLGYQTSTMLTGSMAPLINPGDVVVTKPVPVGEIAVGDIITYSIRVEDHRIETHRITELIANPDGTTAVRTKGDANNGADPWTATIDGAKVDRHMATVPYVGSAIRALRQPIVLNVLMYGAPAVLVVSMLANIWRKRPETEESPAASKAEALA